MSSGRLILFTLATALAFCSMSSASIPCPNSRYTRLGNKCYRFGGALKVNFDRAKAICAAENAKLAEPRNAAENTAITTAFKGTYWFGMAERAQEGAFVYESDGSPVVFTNFQAGEPNDYQGTDEDCINSFQEFGQRWNDDNCASSWQFVCEALNSDLEDMDCFEPNTIFVESSVPNVASEDACFQLCNNVAACEFYTYSTQTRGCSLKDYLPSNIVQATSLRTGTQLRKIAENDITLVGFAKRTSDARECQQSCQNDEQCQSFTWNGPQSANPNVCVHNYGETLRKLVVSNDGSFVSGPKECPKKQCCNGGH